ncbi:hypothetical protein [Streptomyces sp. NRRL B-24484]|uniref:hypothetical protein n=1 Tax=Streptomyces sp. NRRL B-24484 TaxID=1463833 RepID=UPI0004BE8ED3|nr:hypothetical protein [Streptomyces sp. NRRL B-24484]
MAGKDVEQDDEQGSGSGPWWAGLGTRGAVGLIVLGGVAAVWVTFELPGAPENWASGYHRAARLVAVGLVVLGCTVLSRRRAGAAAVEEAGGQRRD